MLSINNLNKFYNKNQVLFDVNLNISPGEIHGLIGENGAGKTTLIKCAAGIYREDAGTILYDEAPVFDNPKVKEIIGYVADNGEYIPSYTVKRMVKMYECFYEGFDKNKFNEMNKHFEIPVGQTIRSMSKGQKMRLAFMLEISKCPKYLMLDEPTSGLDPIAKSSFYEMLIDEVEKRDIGVLISSHNLEGLEKICDSITMLSGGHVQEQHSLEDIKGELTKLNVVFKGDVNDKLDKLSWVISHSNTGSIYTLVAREFDDNKNKTLCELGATLVEPLDISLEELFIALSKR